MKKIILLSVVFVVSKSFADTAMAGTMLGTHTTATVATTSTTTATGTASVTAPAAQPVTSQTIVANRNPFAAAPAPDFTVTAKKHLSLKQKIQDLWAKALNYDYASFNILKKVEQFALGKKKQNSEAIDGVETGIWKHTKRTPATGTAKEVADKLDKAQLEELKKFDKISKE